MTRRKGTTEAKVKKKSPKRLSRKRTFGTEVIGALTEFRDALRDGDSITEKFTVRTVELDLEPRDYDADGVRAVREKLKASQAVLAQLLGVSPATIQKWEQGRGSPSPMARRFLDEIFNDVDHWTRRLEDAAVEVEPDDVLETA